MKAQPRLIRPDWPAPSRVQAVTTTRQGGLSRPPYEAFNLGDHVGDCPEVVRGNREHLRQVLALPSAPRWLRQVHGTQVVPAAGGEAPEADGVWADRPGLVCAVLTADCLPVLLCDRRGQRVAAVHAGWRGLAAGVVEAALTQFPDPGQILAWLGPAIGPDAFEVGEEVRAAFLAADPAAAAAFRPGIAGRWWADLYALARRRLAARGVTAVFGGTYCTFRDAHHFYSYRRDGVTGRMASLIWMQPQE